MRLLHIKLYTNEGLSKYFKMSEIHLQAYSFFKKKSSPGINVLFCQFSPNLSLSQKNSVFSISWIASIMLICRVQAVCSRGVMSPRWDLIRVYKEDVLRGQNCTKTINLAQDGISEPFLDLRKSEMNLC